MSRESLVILTNDLLCNDNGVNGKTFLSLIKLWKEVQPEIAREISLRCEATDGNFYLPEGEKII